MVVTITNAHSGMDAEACKSFQSQETEIVAGE
jgi:hypothetical protein